ncbi:MAG: hypothetical protein GQ470_01185 [Gammaproteobacteria bacterium]|nr:hypothetical protein [Gammaproteobacteria bacterium]
MDYKRAVDGESGARDRVKDLLLKLKSEEPKNPLVMVYLGSTYTLEGRDAWMPWTKMRKTERGLDIMDRAMNMGRGHTGKLDYLDRETDIEIKTICAINFTQVPKMFGRFGQGLELMESIVEDQRYANFSAEQKAEFLYYMGDAAANDERSDDARRYIREALELGLDKGLSARAAEIIEEL